MGLQSWRPGIKIQDGTRQRSSSVLSSESQSDGASSLFSSPRTTSSNSSARSKDGMPRSSIDISSSVKVFLLQCLTQGEDSDVWAGEAVFPGSTQLTPIVAKLAFSADGVELLEHESRIYSHLSGLQLPIPIFHGYFRLSSPQVSLLLLSFVPGQTAVVLDKVEIQKALCVLWSFVIPAIS